ncbi:Exodeoxyribonuclease VII large subunit [Lachnospiraceae bacterium XBB2008]|nr:Exodeoxyribonuclease VII large subunit [Lachnospiraceae bacterium XBB2008]
MKNTYTVSEITKYIKNMFTQDFVLNSVKVSGEVSNCKYHSSGHIYFTVKDDKSQMSAVMFASDRRGLQFELNNGDQVEIEGRVDIYEKGGSYQLYAKKITLAGAGDLYQRFEALKKELEERGMFAPEYKIPIPRYIKTLGVVTASTGAAVQDIINIATRRNPYVQIILCPAQVQGEGAAQSIVRGIHALEKENVDVMIVGRGGGSIEDLWAFNEEIVAQAIFDSRIPIISAVGHETDFTIADFVADLRAPTPSAAAELAVYEAARLDDELTGLKNGLSSAMYEHVRMYRDRCERYALKLKAASPSNQLLQKKTYAMNLEERMENAMRTKVNTNRHKLDVYITRLKGLSPLDKLNQGYSVAVSDGKGRIRSVSEINAGDTYRLYLSDGYLISRVEEKHDQK